MFIATTSQYAIHFIDKIGIPGMATGLFLNGMGVPGLSEVLLQLGGLAARAGSQNIFILFVLAMVFQLAGNSLSYVIARYGGVEVVDKYGKYIFLSSSDLEKANKFLSKNRWFLVIGGFVPGIQGFIGYIGGLSKIDYLRFISLVAIGKIIWVGGLLAVGYGFGKYIGTIDYILSRFGIAIVATSILALIWYIWSHRTKKVKKNED